MRLCARIYARVRGIGSVLSFRFYLSENYFHFFCIYFSVFLIGLFFMVRRIVFKAIFRLFNRV